ncbi:sensor histidine kinase, partial [Verrucomicrobiota bacterium]
SSRDSLRILSRKTLSQTIEIVIVFSLCVLSSVFRIERPWTMTGCGVVLVLAYILAVIEIALIFGLILPVASPLLGILSATVWLGTIAWSEEWAIRKRLEQLEIAKQKFTDMLVHDLRRRMSSILMSFSLFEEKTDIIGPETRELTNTMRVIAERVLIQINDLLAIRKIEEGQMVLQRERVFLDRILKESLEEHRMAGDIVGVDIKLVGENECEVHVDTNVFARVMANLLWNALEHAPKGSEIEVGYSSAHDACITVYVANRGKPVQQEQKEALFNAFVSARGDSLIGRVPAIGLGLAFCKLAIEAHGGTIKLESPWEESDDGVKVIINLPAS